MVAKPKQLSSIGIYRVIGGCINPFKMAVKFDMGMKCVQYLLVIINFMFLMVGTLLITSASTVLVVYREFEVFIESHYFRPAEVVIAIGAIIILVSLFGGIAAVKQSTVFVKLYSLFLLLLIILEVTAAITAFVIRGSIYTNIETNMIDNLLNYNTSYDAKTSWDYTQKRMLCCGVHHPNNWAPVHVKGPEINEQGYKYTVPYSCCKDWPCDQINERGCLNILSDYVSEIGLMLIYTTIIVEVAQILGLIFACMLTKTIRRVKTEEEMRKQRAHHIVYNQIVNEQEQRDTPVVLDTPSSSDA